MQTKYDVIVIGGGAAGMMAAITAQSRGKSVLILEKNRLLGQKLAITGGGRCNITNAEPDTHVLLNHFGSAKNALYSPFSQFGVADTLSFFEKLGLPLVIQARNRAFPHTERAVDVVKVLQHQLSKLRVKCLTNAPVTQVFHQGHLITGVQTPHGAFAAQKYILATGGVSHAETGSSGDGFGWLKLLGHNVTAPTPTIVPVGVKDPWVKSLAGLTIPKATLICYQDKKQKITVSGSLLFTHFGLSGPIILNNAHHIADLLHHGPIKATIDLYRHLNHQQLDEQILLLLDQNKNKDLKNVLHTLIPPAMISVMSLLEPNLDLNSKCHSVNKPQRKALGHLLKALPLTITHLMGFSRAVVADGGVSLTEIDTKTMQSKHIHNLYIIGDLLNIRRPSGGYSLQLCWTTGYVAGSHI